MSAWANAQGTIRPGMHAWMGGWQPPQHRAQGSAEWVPPGDAHAGTKALNPHHRQKQKRIQLQQLLQQTSLVVPVQ